MLNTFLSHSKSIFIAILLTEIHLLVSIGPIDFFLPFSIGPSGLYWSYLVLLVLLVSIKININIFINIFVS